MISGWMGSLGRLVPVFSTPEMSFTREVPRTFATTLGGRRFTRSAPRGHREWSLSANGGYANELAAVESFASGDWGDGPFWWLSPWAVGVNTLSPGGSVLKYADLAGGTVAGPVQAVDGTWFPSSVVSAGSVHAVARSASRNYMAVPRGTVYTASLYVSAGQRVRVLERESASGPNVATQLSAVSSGAGLRRVSVTATAAQETNLLILDVVGSGVCAGAALTFTPDLVAWGVGDGCLEAIVSSTSMSVRVVNSQGWADQSFTIMEVGG